MRSFARLTGLIVLLYGAWMVTINLFEAVTGSNTYEPPWMLLVVLGFGVIRRHRRHSLPAEHRRSVEVPDADDPSNRLGRDVHLLRPADEHLLRPR